MNAKEVATMVESAFELLIRPLIETMDTETQDKFLFGMCGMCTYEIMALRGFEPHRHEGSGAGNEMNALLERLQRQHQEARN